MARGVAVVAVAVVGAAGCDLVFAPADYDRAHQTLELTTAYVGTAIEDQPTAIADGDAVYLILDPTGVDGFTRIPAVIRDDRWYAPLPVGADAEVMFHTPDVDFVRIWKLPGPDVVGRTAVLRRADAVAGDPLAAVTTDVTLESTFLTGAFSVYAVGAWVELDYTEKPAIGASQFTAPTKPYSAFYSVNTTTRWRITAADQVAVLRYNADASNLVGAATMPAFDQAEATTLAGLVEDLPLSTQAAFAVDPTSTNRLAGCRPAVSMSSMAWALTAAPGLSLGLATGPQLARGAIIPSSPALVQASYANPFPWPTALRGVSNAYRAVVLDGTASTAYLYAGTGTIADAGTTTSMLLDPPVPLLITIAGMDLYTDNLIVPMERTAAVEIRATFDRTATGVFEADLYRIEPDGSFVTRVKTAELVSTDPVWRVPQSVFDVGSRYVIRVLVISEGRPNAATGDVATFSLPFTIGYLDSGLFEAR